MTKIAVAALALFSEALPALADRESDLRWAEAEGRPGLCTSIRDDDLRWSCRAAIEGREGQCASVKDSAKRALCRARARR